MFEAPYSLLKQSNRLSFHANHMRIAQRTSGSAAINLRTVALGHGPMLRHGRSLSGHPVSCAMLILITANLLFRLSYIAIIGTLCGDEYRQCT